MTELVQRLLSRTRLIATLVALLTVLGAGSWLTMPRQEDPSFAERFGTLIVPMPGAGALDVERLVTQPMEEQLEEVLELDRVLSTSRPGVAVFQLRLGDDVAFDATDAAWDEVRRAVERGSTDLPTEALPPSLDTEVGDPATAVVFVTGSGDVLELRAAARTLRERLQRVPGVERVELVGDPGRRVHVELAPEAAQRLGTSMEQVAQRIRAQNVTVPGGSVQVDGRTLIVRHLGELHDAEAIAALPIPLASGAQVPLGTVAHVELAPSVPRSSRVFHQGVPAVGVSVIPAPEQDLVALGGRLQDALDGAAASFAPLELQVFTFQPTLVGERLSDLSWSLITGMGIVAAVLLLAMGPRMGLTVSAIVPLVAVGTIGIYALGGGVLHQISIAALVLALGLLVDNAIVVAEAVQQHKDAGHPSPALAAIQELGIPLGTATGTTVAAFVPMLLAQGGTADFTRTIPLVVIIALTLSYVYALLVTPALAERTLRASQAEAGRLERFGRALASFTTRRPRTVLTVVLIGLAGAAALSRFVPAEFFPMSDRNRVVVSLALPEGTHPLTTEDTVRRLTDALGDDVQTTAFVGGGLPRFYYNLNDSPNSPHRAEIVVTAPPDLALESVVDRVSRVARDFPEATVIGKRLQQGPPVGSPVQIRLHGEDLDALQEATEQVTATLRQTPGARDVRHDLGAGLPTLQFAPRDSWNGRLGGARGALPSSTLAQTHGLDAGQIRNGSDPIGIRVISPSAESTPTEDLLTASVATRTGPVPLLQLATVQPTWQPAALRHRNGQREVTVSAELEPGATFGSVLQAFERQPPVLPSGVQLSYGGEAEGSGEANAALVRTLPVGLGLLVFFLLLEFDSFRRLAIILTTVPLAAVGVVPGLALTGQPFGFMSMLGVIALVGIVVNNAIVLLNVIERQRSEGHAVDEAIREAVRVRLRPILLTTLTTVAGMVPLALSSSALWPPLASAMISGLLASTALTLVAVPALYAVLFSPRPPRRWWIATLLLPAATASAAPMTLPQVLDATTSAPLTQAAAYDARASRREANAAWLSSTTPTFSSQVEARRLQEAVAIDTPLGPIVQQPKELATIGVVASQPLIDPMGWANATAQAHGARARQLQAARTREEQMGLAGDLFLDLVVTRARTDALDVQIAALEETVRQARDLHRAGLALELDANRASVALADARQARLALEVQAEVGEAQLGALLGREEPIQPVFDDAVAFPTSSRPDLQAARRAESAADAERAAWGLSMLPRVALEGSWQASDNPNLVKSNWTAGQVTATWQLGLGQAARLDAASARRQASRQRTEALENQVRIERLGSARTVRLRQADVAVREVSKTLADDAAAVLQDRYAQQLAPLTDLLQARADQAAQTSALAQARVEQVRARLQLALAGGAPERGQ